MAKFIKALDQCNYPTWFIGDPNKEDFDDQCNENLGWVPDTYHVMTKEEALEIVFDNYRKYPTHPYFLKLWDNFYKCYSGNVSDDDDWYRKEEEI